MADANSQHWILWDGDCGFCRRVIAWVKARDTQAKFCVVPYQEAPSPPMTPELTLDCDRAVYVVTADGRKLRAGRAALFILERVGWGWFAQLLSLPPFIWFVELVYWIVARNRDLFARVLFTRE